MATTPAISKPAGKNRICALVGGGTSSLALLWKLSAEYASVLPIFVQSGLRWEESELYWLKKFFRTAKLANVEPLEILPISLRDTYQNHWCVTGVKVPDGKASPQAITLPGRQLLFLAKTALFIAQQKLLRIAVGNTQEYPLADAANESYLKDLKSVLSRAINADLTIIAPFLNQTKDQVIYEFKDLAFEYSFSCLCPKGYQHCGDCYKCQERKTAFNRISLNDRTHYYKPYQPGLVSNAG